MNRRYGGSFTAAIHRGIQGILLLSLLLGLGGCRKARGFWQHRVLGKPAVRAGNPAQIRRGREAYQRYCALCHAPDATGYRADHANAIGNPDFLAVASDEFLRSSITDGRPGTPMSSWGRAHGGPLDPSQVNDIIAFLRTFSRRPRVAVERIAVPPAQAENARSVWLSRCAECHGPAGEGSNRAISLSHPNFQRAVSNGFLRYTIEHGRRGTPMAGFSQLGTETINSLVALIRTFERLSLPAPPPPPPGPPPPSLDQLVLNPTAGPPTFHLREERYVPAAEVARALSEGKRMVILDARPTPDWGLAHIPGALPFPFYDIEQMATRLPRDGTWILAYCACPHAASGHVVDELRRRGFQRTAVIDEGITHWLAQGYPSVRAGGPPAQAPSGSH